MWFVLVWLSSIHQALLRASASIYFRLSSKSVSNPFGGLSVFAGDYGQLPPVFDKPVWAGAFSKACRSLPIFRFNCDFVLFAMCFQTSCCAFVSACLKYRPQNFEDRRPNLPRLRWSAGRRPCSLRSSIFTQKTKPKHFSLPSWGKCINVHCFCVNKQVRIFAQSFQLNYGLQPTALQIARYVASLQFVLF